MLNPIQIFKLIGGVILALIILPLDLFICLLCWILSPVLPIFAIGKNVLPNWLSWFQTPDAPLDGDSGFVNVVPLSYPKYIRRVLWLIRNPAYGFSWTVLAAKPDHGTKIVTLGNINSGDGPYVKGWSFTYVEGYHYFHFRLFLPTFKGMCLQFRFGWKMKGDAKYLHEVGTAPYKFNFTFNPFKVRK